MQRVFLVDDEPWVLLGLKNLIDWEAAGYVICGEATDGLKAWERINRLKPDVVFSDIRIPGFSGIELLKKIREEELKIEVVLISGYSEFEYARSGIQYGCAEYLLKPVYEEDLLECLEKLKKRNTETHEVLQDCMQLSEGDGKRFKSETKIAEEMLQHMQEHYCEVTQQELAVLFSLSNSAVSQMIKKHTGKNYSEHLLEIRILKAQELLRQTDESIEKIAELVGYNDYFYFTKVFKKATGISPSSFRRNL